MIDEATKKKVEKLRRRASFKRSEADDLRAEADGLDDEAAELEETARLLEGTGNMALVDHARKMMEWADDPQLTMYDNRDVRQALIELRLAQFPAPSFAVDETQRIRNLTDEQVRDEIEEITREIEYKLAEVAA